MLQITKFEHSCLLVSDGKRHILIDPGMMSSDLLRGADLPKLDSILITHVHGDHLDPTYVQEYMAVSPDTKLYGPPQVAASLETLGLSVQSETPQGVALLTSPHEPGDPLFETPEQYGYHIFGALTHPGDSHHFDQTMPILALPVTAPWGASTNAIKLALALKPRYVVPIHDWHWSAAARTMMYDRFTQVLAEQGITFLALDNQMSVEVDLTA